MALLHICTLECFAYFTRLPIFRHNVHEWMMAHCSPKKQSCECTFSNHVTASHHIIVCNCAPPSWALRGGRHKQLHKGRCGTKALTASIQYHASKNTEANTKYKHLPEKQTYALKQQRVGQGLGGARVVERQRMWKMIKHPGTDFVSLSKSLLLHPPIGELGAET